MASVYSSFVGPTKMLLAKKAIPTGKEKEKKNKKGGLNIFCREMLI